MTQWALACPNGQPCAQTVFHEGFRSPHSIHQGQPLRPLGGDRRPEGAPAAMAVGRFHQGMLKPLAQAAAL